MTDCTEALRKSLHDISGAIEAAVQAINKCLILDGTMEGL